MPEIKYKKNIFTFLKVAFARVLFFILKKKTNPNPSIPYNMKTLDLSVSLNFNILLLWIFEAQNSLKILMLKKK